MKIRMFGSILLAIICGYIFGKIIFNEYNHNILNVFNEKETVYFLQQGVYSTVSSMEKNTKTLKNYIYSKEDDYFKVLAAITKDEQNATKLKEFFIALGNDIYIREVKLSNRAFINILEQYDKLLALTDDHNNINNIVKEVLSQYQELVVGAQSIN